MDTYTTLDGRVLDLAALTDAERAHLQRCYEAYRANTAWEDFRQLVFGRANPVVAAAGGRVTQAVWDHPLFQAVRDLEDRLGIRQGEVAPDPGDDTEHDPLEDAWVGAVQAAAQKGVSLTAIHYAVRRGELLARRPGGRRLEVSTNSLRRWEPNRVRQQAGRARVSA